jgi:hypothetical protein
LFVHLKPFDRHRSRRQPDHRLPQRHVPARPGRLAVDPAARARAAQTPRRQQPQAPPPLACASPGAARVPPSARGKDCVECATRFFDRLLGRACPHPIRLGGSPRKHPTELARGRLKNSHSEPIIQRATAILQVARKRKNWSRAAVPGGRRPCGSGRWVTDAGWRFAPARHTLTPRTGRMRGSSRMPLLTVVGFVGQSVGLHRSLLPSHVSQTSALQRLGTRQTTTPLSQPDGPGSQATSTSGAKLAAGSLLVSTDAKAITCGYWAPNSCGISYQCPPETDRGRPPLVLRAARSRPRSPLPPPGAARPARVFGPLRLQHAQHSREARRVPSAPVYRITGASISYRCNSSVI